MRATSPSAFFTSLTLHGVVAGLIIFLTYYAARQESTPPVIFELVAGPPTAPDELVAPALGNSATPVKLDLPKVEPQPEKPQPQAVTKAPEPEVAEPVPPPKTTPTKPKPDTSLVKELKKSEKMSYKDYLKKHPIPKDPPKTATVAKGGKVPRIDAEGIAEGVRGGSTANKRGGGGGKALTREEQSQLNTYISFLLNALKEAHEPPPGVSDQLVTQVTFDITASGSILNPRITKSSGNREFDESVLDAFRRVKTIGDVPTGKSETWTLKFRMRDE
ncbi:MAG: TonB family protein [Opitutae bacterium]|nr:TonB family protein [Opitutae bacterium]